MRVSEIRVKQIRVNQGLGVVRSFPKAILFLSAIKTTFSLKLTILVISLAEAENFDLCRSVF